MVERARDHIFHTLFLRELLSARAGDDLGVFIITRPPGLTVLARRVRLLGSVVHAEIKADGSQWVLLDDTTATCAVHLLPSLPFVPAELGCLLEVIGELASGEQVGIKGSTASLVHVCCSHFKAQSDPLYELSRWRTLQQQRKDEYSKAAGGAQQGDRQTTTGQGDSAYQGAVDPAAEQPALSSLRNAVLAALGSDGGDGMRLVELVARVPQALTSGAADAAQAVEASLAELEEGFVVYRNQDRYHLL
jgi:hypothetical protein